jgi:hypothetical protein
MPMERSGNSVEVASFILQQNLASNKLTGKDLFKSVRRSPVNIFIVD